MATSGAQPRGDIAVRQRFRQLGRQVVCHPVVQPLHEQRLSLALELAGAEPAQGALADFFLGCGDAPAADKLAALDRVRHRLTQDMARRFEASAGRADFAACSAMATRWSVLATASLEVPRRILRCSSDDSRVHAAAAVRAWRDADAPAQREFLDHCLVCRDTMAFLLARRALLRLTPVLPMAWAEVFDQLQAMVLRA